MKTNRQFKLLLLAIASIFLFFSLIAIYITGFNYLSYLKVAKGNYLKIDEERAPRGLIFDREGRALTINEKSKLLIIDKKNIKEDLNFRELLSAYILEDRNIVVKELNDEEALKVIPLISSKPGVTIKETFRRRYLDDYNLSHILGFVGIKASSLDLQGKAGIEKFYDSYLTGKGDQVKYVVNSKGEILGIEDATKKRVGSNLYLTIDYKIQRKATQVLKEVIESLGLKAGALIVSIPKTGEILAAQSFPLFNSNDLTKNNDQNRSSYFNRFTSGLYAPGSIFKLIVALGALDSRLITGKEEIYAPKELRLESQFEKNKFYLFRDWRDHGHLDLIKAIAYSSNSYFYKVGGGYKNEIESLGMKRIIKYAKSTFFGKKLNIDLPNEKEGNLKYYDNTNFLRIGDVYNLSIGQGFLLATLLQINTMTNFFANNGYYFTPHLAKNLNNYQPIKLPYLNEYIELVRKGMEASVEIGTSKKIKEGLSITAGAKTGTAQITNKKENSLFTIFWPFENPQFSITVIIEEGGEGGGPALQVAKRIIEYMIDNNYIIKNY